MTLLGYSFIVESTRSVAKELSPKRMPISFKNSSSESLVS